MKQIKHACFVWSILFCSHLPAQNIVNQVDSLAGNLVKTLRSGSKEKIFLQTNRKVYAAGEKIWFKAFLVNALSNRIDTASKNLFVDLVNDKDKPVTQLVLNATAMRTNGVITLGDSLETGYYWLRSYTQKMVQQDLNGIFLQPLYIVNTKKPAAENTARAAKPFERLNISFSPEGGSLITGMNSTGALRVVDAAGNPLQVSGNIINNKDSVVAGFATNRFGLGRVTFYPKWFEKYEAVVHYNGQAYRCAINAWNPFAAQVSVIKQDGENIQAYISLEDSIYTRKYTTYILAVSKDSVCFAGIGRGMCQVDIPVKDFPGGPATILLFNEDRQLVSERQVFINKDNYSLNIGTNKTNYAARDKVSLQFELKDATGRPLVGALNVAAEDGRVMDMSDVVAPDNLRPSNLSFADWINREHSNLTAEETDLFMLAQPPMFKKTLADSKNGGLRYEDNNELLLHLYGKVADKKNNPLKDRVVTEMEKDGNNTFFDVDTTGIGGGFRLNLPEGRENMQLMLQVSNTRGNTEKNDNINVDTFSFPRFATPAVLKSGFTVASISPAEQVKKYHIDTVFVGVGKEWLKPVIVKSKTRKPDTYNTSKRISDFSYVISQQSLNQGGYGNVGAMLLNVPGVSLKGGYVAFLGGTGWGSSSKSEPMVLLDGVQIPTTVLGGSGIADTSGAPHGSPVGMTSPVLEFLNSLNPEDIDFIEVLRGADADAYGVEAGNGVIAINTRTHAENFVNGPLSLAIVSPRTYHVAPEFAMPDYADRDVKNAKENDLRNTVYWNGNLLTDTNGKASVSFYTADAATTYSVVVTGITANGDYVYKRITINRK